MPRKRHRAVEIIHKLWDDEVALAQGKLTAEAKLDKVILKEVASGNF